MDHYIDIKLLPDPEISSTFLMNSLFGKWHRFLVANPELNLGVSFPKMASKNGCGCMLRLHGDKTSLNSVETVDWLGGLRGYLQVSAINAMPEECERVTVRRVQAKTNPERLARRYQKRHNVSEQEALTLYATLKPKELKLPYLQLNSESSGQRFRLHIEQKTGPEEAVTGQFNRYGISQTANLPWF